MLGTVGERYIKLVKARDMQDAEYLQEMIDYEGGNTESGQLDNYVIDTDVDNYNYTYITREEINANLQKYIQSRIGAEGVDFDPEYKILKQYGIGSVYDTGSYDRYVPFKLYPEANFLVISWPLGLLQASCNPYKANRELKGVNLGEIAQEAQAAGEIQNSMRTPRSADQKNGPSAPTG